MGKYRLRSRKAGSVITLLEVDTESRAWYIQAEHKESALQALKDMGQAILCVESIYINGDDVSEEVFSSLPSQGAPMAASPVSAAPMAEEATMTPPPEEPPLPDVPDLPDDFPVFPSAEDIAQAASQEAEPLPPEDMGNPGLSMPESLPSLTSVLPKSAFVATPKEGKKGPDTNGMFLGKKHIVGDPIEIRTIHEEQDGVVFAVAE